MPSQQEFTELLQPNLLPLNRFVFGMVGNQFDAEDIVQETVVKAFVHFADFRAESKFKTWLMSIAVNEVRTRRRTEYRSRLTYFDFDQLERLASATSNGDSPYRQYQEQETTRMVQNAVVSLHPTYKEMIHLRAIDGLNIADTARRLSISVAAAKARYYRAVHRLSHTLVRQNRRPLRRDDRRVDKVKQQETVAKGRRP
jgi:RNA polymerase sigma-70 factor (ECF subfamily)